ncbi:MAG: tetratricopeptide repeat protein [Gemmataceae bacterium]
MGSSLLRFFAYLFLALTVITSFSGIILFGWYQSHLRAARRSVFLGHNRASIRHLDSCRQIRPDNPELLLLCARVARRAGNWLEAEDLLDRVWKQQGDSDDLVLERLLLRASRGELDQTMPVLLPRIQLQSPESSLAREAIIFGLLYQFRLLEADRQIEGWLQAEPDRAMAWFQKGKREELRDATPDAILAYQKALELDSDYDEAALRLLPLLLQEYKLEEAAAVLESFRDRLGEQPEMQTHTAHLLIYRER